jgi:serine/threonine protein kinase
MTKDILAFGLRYCTTIIDEHCGLMELSDPIQTNVHMVVPALTKKFGRVAMKIKLKELEFQAEHNSATKGRYPLIEMDALRLLDRNSDFSVSLYCTSPDKTWFIRNWHPGEVLSQLKGFSLTPVATRDLWRLFEKAFDLFHTPQEPWLIRDIKPSNVLYAAGRFSLFDFSTTMPLAQLNGKARRSRLGTRTGRFWAPELLSDDGSPIRINSDYFSFATMLFYFLKSERGPVWQNRFSDISEARTAYMDEYLASQTNFAKVLAEQNFDRTRIDFLVACLNPDAGQRPDYFIGPDTIRGQPLSWAYHALRWWD